MWLLSFLPNWIFYVILFIGFFGLLSSRFIPAYYKTAVVPVLFFMFVFGTFMSGAIYDNNAWVARVKEMEAKVAEAEQQSKVENAKIETKIVTKTQIIRERGQDNIKFIDREVTKYDNTCVIPKEFIDAHNKAASK